MLCKGKEVIQEIGELRIISKIRNICLLLGSKVEMGTLLEGKVVLLLVVKMIVVLFNRMNWEKMNFGIRLQRDWVGLASADIHTCTFCKFRSF